jgi:hypothetical protein
MIADTTGSTDWPALVNGALHALGYADDPDEYQLAAAAIRKLSKGS